ncbi:MAG: cytochrome c biogenesis protein CcdA [Nocardioides sp.]|nr:cytochrome c biogenesis protein CcdA [Nocardioides sp.]
MVEWFQSTAGSGSMALAIPVALVAGLVSFFSPCVIPLLPGYLSYATGLSGADIASGEARRGRMLAGAVLFVLGFSAVFVTLGVASAGVAVWFAVNREALNLGLGAICILLGLVFLGALPRWQRDFRIHRVPAVGLAAAPLLGALFAIGWQPCVGPTFGVIATLAISEGSAPRGGLLLGFYSLGLGVPFVVAALAWRRTMVAVTWMRRHQVAVTRVGGGMMILVGVLLVSGLWDQAVTWIQLQLVSDFEVSV